VSRGFEEHASRMFESRNAWCRAPGSLKRAKPASGVGLAHHLAHDVDDRVRPALEKEEITPDDQALIAFRQGR